MRTRTKNKLQQEKSLSMQQPKKLEQKPQKTMLKEKYF